MNTPAQLPLREHKKRQARGKILVAAQQLIEERGFENTRMREIAALAEISYQTLYNYFPTKALILQAILTHSIQHISQQIDDVLQSYEGGLLEALDTMNTIRFSAIRSQDRALWRIVTTRFVNQASETHQIYQTIDKRAHEALEALLFQARDSGELTAQVDLVLLAETIFSLGQHSLAKYLLTPHMEFEAALNKLGRQMRLLITPYLRP